MRAAHPVGRQSTIALEGTLSLNLEGLIDSFVRDAHRFILLKIDRKSVGNLCGRPALYPFVVPAMWFIPSIKRRLPRVFDLTLKHLCDT